MKPIKSDRSFGAYLVLSFLTCGIYGIYFLHKMAKDTNVICAEDGKWTPNVLVFCLLSLCTCGIYGIFWWTGIADRTKRFGRQLNQHIPNEPSSVMGWFIGGIFSTISDIIMTKKFRTLYDAEDAERLKRHLAEEALEAEKERIRAERRAANPEGQLGNMSKKKQQQKKLAEAEAARAAAAKEYAAKHGIVIEEEEDENKPLSGIAERPWCKGRAYDPNRYSNPTEE